MSQNLKIGLMMKFDELIEIIKMSEHEDWNIITCWGFGSGPSYKSKFEFYEVRGKNNTGVLTEDSHGMYACYKNNVSISLAFGMTANPSFKEKWATQFPDVDASSHYLDIFYNNTLVERIVYVIVDGGRAKLPLPQLGNVLVVSERDYKIIKLLDTLESNPGNFESYFERAGLQLGK